MDWTALGLSLRLALATVAILLPLAFLLARWLAYGRFKGRGFVEALVALPLILPPTVIGFYLLTAFSQQSPLGPFFQSLLGRPLAFSFEGLVLASVLVNLPFAVQPMQNALAAIPGQPAGRGPLLRPRAAVGRPPHRVAPRAARHRHGRRADLRPHARRVRRRADGRRIDPG